MKIVRPWIHAAVVLKGRACESEPCREQKIAQLFYAPQTKILEGGTKDEIQIFEALFKGVSTRFGLRTLEKSVENLDFIFCSSFQNLRLGGIKLVINLGL
jgi:hypothetical protein